MTIAPATEIKFRLFRKRRRARRQHLREYSSRSLSVPRWRRRFRLRQGAIAVGRRASSRVATDRRLWRAKQQDDLAEGIASSSGFQRCSTPGRGSIRCGTSCWPKRCFRSAAPGPSPTPQATNSRSFPSVQWNQKLIPLGASS